jgi:hypothetical protein
MLCYTFQLCLMRMSHYRAGMADFPVVVFLPRNLKVLMIEKNRRWVGAVPLLRRMDSPSTSAESVWVNVKKAEDLENLKQLSLLDQIRFIPLEPARISFSDRRVSQSSN